MVICVKVADTVTGEQVQTLPISGCTWEQRYLSPEKITVQVTLKPRGHQRMDVRNATAEQKSTLIVMDDDRVLAAGPISSRQYDDSTGRLQVEADGILELLKARFVRPVHANVDNLVIASGDDEGEPNPAVRTEFLGQSWPRIVRGLIEQSMEHPGGALPLKFAGDGVGEHDRSWEAASFVRLGDAIEDLTRLLDGPEVAFVPRIVDNRLEYLVLVGDDSNREIASSTVHRFDFTPSLRSVRNLREKSSGSNLAADCWGSGGRQKAKAIYARATSERLLDLGYPRRESVSAAHSTVVEQETLEQYTAEDLEYASRPMSWWSWEFHADKSPRLADVQVGDYCRVHIKGNRYFPDSPPEGFLRRIVALSGDSKSRWVSVTTDGEHTW